MFSVLWSITASFLGNGVTFRVRNLIPTSELKCLFLRTLQNKKQLDLVSCDREISERSKFEFWKRRNFSLEMCITQNVTIFNTCFTNIIEFTYKYSWGKINTLGTNTWGSAQVLLQQIIFFCNLSFAVHYLAQWRGKKTNVLL